VKRSGLAVVLIALVGTTVAAENERAVSVGVGWATFSVPGKPVGQMVPPALSPDVGGALSVTYEHAIGTDLMLRGSLTGGVFYGGQQDKQTATSYAGLGDVGVVVRFDVLKYVPYGFAGVGVVAFGGGPIDRTMGPDPDFVRDQLDFVLSVGGGVDVLSSRARSYGIEARLASFGGDIAVFTLGIRGTTRWGYF
jgi:hypothetical protein